MGFMLQGKQGIGRTRLAVFELHTQRMIQDPFPRSVL
jgi:hypothetical protein